MLNLIPYGFYSQPALVSYGGSGKLDVSHKPRVWSLLKQLNTALKDKQYLISVGQIIKFLNLLVRRKLS